MRARLIVLGRQGAGKGTQCVRLAKRLGVPHVSTGDLFRAEMASGSPLGAELGSYVDAGRLVPDGLVLDVLARRLAGGPGRRAGGGTEGYLLDGFPRTLAQAEAMYDVLGDAAAELAVELHVPVEVVVARLANRVVCPSCAAVGTAPAGTTVGCGDCGVPMRRRADDNVEAISRRLALYEEQSGPLLEWFDQRGLLVRVDGAGGEEAVHARLVAALGARATMPALER